MKKLQMLAEVKAIDTDDPNGAFEVILSAPTLDRDGEIIDIRAFEPLPSSIPFHAFHNFTDPVGRAEPFYADDGTLHARGTYASTLRAQEIRTLVKEGVIGHTSVGFMAPKREVKDGVPHITSGELLEGSFVSVPSNREAAIMAAKAYREESRPARTMLKTVAGSYEERAEQIRDALRDLHPEAWWVYVIATFDDAVVYELDTDEGTVTYRTSYELSDGTVTLGSPEDVDVTEVVETSGVPEKSVSTDPETAAAPAAAAPADVVPARTTPVVMAAEAAATAVLTQE